MALCCCSTGTGWALGEHTVTALVDGSGVRPGDGAGDDRGAKGIRRSFCEGAVGECVAGDFPLPGQTTTLEWQQSQQNFVITEVQ